MCNVKNAAATCLVCSYSFYTSIDGDEKIAGAACPTLASSLRKQTFPELLTQQLDDYSSLYVLLFDNVDNKSWINVINDWHPSRMHKGKKVMSTAQSLFGATPADELRPALHQVSKVLEDKQDAVALLLTSCASSDVEA